MTSEYHEENLSEKAKSLHRALKSLQEELEAVDWYQQREDVSENEELNEILNHNKKEETEHAAMLLEWLRRNDPAFEEHLKTYLFTNLPIVEVEEAAESGNENSAGENQNHSLGIGSQKKQA